MLSGWPTFAIKAMLVSFKVGGKLPSSSHEQQASKIYVSIRGQNF